MPAYVIYHGDVPATAQYDKYTPMSAASISAAGGRLIVRGGEFEVLEGTTPLPRTVVIEFPTRQAAVDWYNSAAYVEARHVREGAAVANMYVVDGYDG